MGTGKNWKIENGEYLFLLDTLFIMRILIFPNCYKKKRSIKKTRQIFENQQIFDELPRRYHK